MSDTETVNTNLEHIPSDVASSSQSQLQPITQSTPISPKLPVIPNTSSQVSIAGMSTTPHVPDYFRPFTLIFFSRKVDPITNIIAASTAKTLNIPDGQDVWTHVGIVITRQVCPTLIPKNPSASDNNQTPYLWESTFSSASKLFTVMEKIADCETGKYMFGVQIRKLTDVLDAAAQMGIKTVYTRDYVSTQQFTNPSNGLISDIGSLKAHFVQRKYETNPFQIYAAFNENGDQTLVEASVSQYVSSPYAVFSSQFVTVIYQAIGAIAINSNIHPRTMLPHELAVPSTSDNASFRQLYGAQIKLTPISDTATPTNVCYGLYNFALTNLRKLAIKLYQSQVQAALQAIVDRLPTDSLPAQIIKDVAEVGLNIAENTQIADTS